MSDTPTWFRQGDTPDPKISTGDRGSRKRYWLREEEKDYVTFLDDDPFRITEHSAKIQGKWGTRFTCITGFGSAYGICPGCPPQRTRNWCTIYNVGYLSVVSEREFEYQGKTYKNLRRLMPLKKSLLDEFDMSKKEQGGTLVGARFRVFRSGPKAYSVGDRWAFQGFIEDVPHNEMVTALENENFDEFERLSLEARKAVSKHYEYTDKEGVPAIYDAFDYQELIGPPQTRSELLVLLGKSEDFFRTGETQNASSGTPASTNTPDFDW